MKSFVLALSLFLSLSVQAFEHGKIAMVQFNADSYFGDYDRNLSLSFQLVEEASRNGAKIIVLPEGAIYGYAVSPDTPRPRFVIPTMDPSEHFRYWCAPPKLPRDSSCADVRDAAENIPLGRTAQQFVSESMRLGVYVVFNLIEVDSNGTFFNTAVIVGPQGYVGKYRKRELYVRDANYAEAGSSPFVLDTPYGKFGLLICLDAATFNNPHFEEYRNLGVNGILLTMNWDQDPNHYPDDGDIGISRVARLFFQKVARLEKVDIFASDQSMWDGAGMYPKDGSPRQRNGMAPIAINVQGITYSDVNY